MVDVRDRIECLDVLWPVTAERLGGEFRLYCAPFTSVQVVGTDYAELLPLLRDRLTAHLEEAAMQRAEYVAP